MTDRYETAFVDAFARIATQPRPGRGVAEPQPPNRRGFRPGARWLGAGLAAAALLVAAFIVVPGLLDGERPIEAVPARTPSGVSVTLVAGQPLDVQFQALSAATGIAVADLEAVARNWEELGTPPWAENGLEGFLHPGSYQVPDGATAAEALQLATARFGQESEAMGFERAADELGIPPYQALIVASLVQQEGRRAEDLPKIARVIYNRLDAGMKLQLDSSVAYAAGRSDAAPTSAGERAIESPYNTYLHGGLPPGPIGSPDELALAAAVRPADGPWRYFTTVDLDTGETEFSATLAEQQASVAKFRDWCQASDDHRERCGLTGR